MQDIVNWKKA